MPGTTHSRAAVRLSVAAASLLAGIAGALISTDTSAASSTASYITGGQTLTAGQTLDSPDDHYQLEMGSDGNLVETVTVGGRVLWQSNTSGNSGAYAVLEPTGELVVDSSSGSTLWSDQATTSGCPALNILNDGKVEVDNASSAVWSTGENSVLEDGEYLESGQVIYDPSYGFYLTMQPDGNLVIWNGSSTLWSTGTSGNPGAEAVLQGDGTLVVWSPSEGQDIWTASGTYGNSGDYAEMQGDGNFVVYNSSGAVWSSGTSNSSPSATSMAPQPAQYGSASACPGTTTGSGTSGSGTSTAPASGSSTSTSAPSGSGSSSSGSTTTTSTTATSTGPTSTVVSVSQAAGTAVKSKTPAVKVPLAFHWSWKGSKSHLSRIIFGKVPAGLKWTATVTPAKKGRRAKVLTASTVTQRRALLLWLENQSYVKGETVKLTLARSGYTAETVTFKIRLHDVPTVVAPSVKKKTTKS